MKPSQPSLEPDPVLRQLVSELQDGTLNPEAHRQLQTLLTSEANMAWYIRMMRLHGSLHFELAHRGDGASRSALRPWFDVRGMSALREQGPEARRELTRGRRRSVVAVVMGLAAMLLVAAILWQGRQEEQSVSQSASEQELLVRNTSLVSVPVGVAVLTHAAYAKWELPSDGGISTGRTLPAGQYRLAQGLIQLEFFNGASVVLEGPAEFSLVSSELMGITRGRARAHVPTQAQGFTISTPDYHAKDLGTEFAVSVDDDGRSDFQVLDGEVQLVERGQPSHTGVTLTANQRFVGATGTLLNVVDVAHSIPGRREVLEAVERGDRESFDAWKEHRAVLKESKHMVLYYGFDNHAPWDRELRNESPRANSHLDGAIVGCRWTTGRWPNKNALEFKRTGDRIRLNVPGEFDSVTLGIWVRIEGFDRWLSSLLLTDGHDPGELHWQLTDDGILVLGVKDEGGVNYNYMSKPCLSVQDLGRWVFLAAVYDGKSGVVTHYIDGEPVSSEATVTTTKLRIGTAEIGNWEIGKWAPKELVHAPVRSLNGRVDEFMLFDVALQEDDIQKLYQSGRP